MGTTPEKFPRNVYPGSFDPFHYSHQETHRRAEEVLGEDVSLLVVQNYIKDISLFSASERKDLIARCIPEEKIHIVQNNEELLEYFSRAQKIVRGIRFKLDSLEALKLFFKKPQFTAQIMFEFWKKRCQVFVDENNKHISSRLLKILVDQGDIETAQKYTTSEIVEALQGKMEKTE